MHACIYTRANEANSGGKRRLGINKNKLEDRIGWGSDQVIESPLEGVGAVIAVFDANHHHLPLWWHFVWTATRHGLGLCSCLRPLESCDCSTFELTLTPTLTLNKPTKQNLGKSAMPLYWRWNCASGGVLLRPVPQWGFIRIRRVQLYRYLHRVLRDIWKYS